MRRQRRTQARLDPVPYGRAQAPVREATVANGSGSSSWLGMVKDRLITPLTWLWGGNGSQEVLALPAPEGRDDFQRRDRDAEPEPPAANWDFPTHQVAADLLENRIDNAIAAGLAARPHQRRGRPCRSI